MKFDVRNRWSGEVQFTAEIDCADDAPMSIKLGLAVKRGVNAGANLAGADLAGANLAGANLAGAYLADADLADAYLADAYLADAYLARADIAGANLLRAKLAGADLADAYLADAYLADANLGNANLGNAYLAGANLGNANLGNANLAGANLLRANLAGAHGNNDYVRSIFTGVYAVAYTADVMQIGCQRHPIADWWAFDDRRILEMDGRRAADFWAVWKPLLQQIIAAAPAKPTGYVAPVAEPSPEAA